MRDEERIEMYYKFGMSDWKSEEQVKVEKRLKTLEHSGQQNLKLKFATALNLFLDRLASL